jgi:DNA mismatch endonuclease (patch repair protein)
LTDYPAPAPSASATRAVMRANRSRDTAPELALRRELHKRGLRYRVDYAPIPGLRCRPDIVFTRQRVAVFVDGCYWHRCPQHAATPKANAPYWQAKFDRNARRDRRNDVSLASAGWTVVRVWEHESAAEAVGRVLSALHR